MDEPLAELVLHSDDDLLGMLSDDLVKPGAESGSPEICPWHSFPLSLHSASALTNSERLRAIVSLTFSHLHFTFDLVWSSFVCCVCIPFICFNIVFLILIIWFYLVWVPVGLDLCPFQVDSSPSSFGKICVGTAVLGSSRSTVPPLLL